MKRRDDLEETAPRDGTQMAKEGTLEGAQSLTAPVCGHPREADARGDERFGDDLATEAEPEAEPPRYFRRKQPAPSRAV